MTTSRKPTLKNMIDRTKGNQLRRLATLIAGMVLMPAPLILAQAVKQETGAASSAQPSTSVPVERRFSDASDDIVMLSPFQVDARKEKGYFAENTLAGSRMKTNVGDLAASISIVTKQQMEDTASLDINDVFRYEVNTEGSNTYTPQVAIGTSATFKDTIGGNTNGGDMTTMTNATSNRVRGLAAPGGSLNYYAINNNVPFDSYNTQSVEISRGPNSLLFGMGSPAGIVNQSTAQAAINKNVANVSFRVDDKGSNRVSFSFNKALIKDKLAIYGALLYNDQQFDRKPSYDITRRQYGAITYKPFKKTVIRAMVEGYTNENRRPNFLTPRDFVTTWNVSGRPVYDPVSRTIRQLDGNMNPMPVVLNNASPYIGDVRNYIASLPGYNASLWNGAKTQYNGQNITGSWLMNTRGNILYTSGIAPYDEARPLLRVDNGNLVDYIQRQPVGVAPYFPAGGVSTPAAVPTSATIYASPAMTSIYDRIWTQSAALAPPTLTTGGTTYTYGSYPRAGVTDKSIYDWSHINTNQANYGSSRNAYYNVEIEQEILPNLFASAGWLRQDYDLVSNYTIAQQAGSTLYVDTNERLPDGSPNPYLGLPYVEDYAPDTVTNSETTDNYKAMLAYTPDFTRNKGWTRWLGRHQFMGMWSYQKTDSRNFRKRLVFVDADEKGALRYLTNRNPKADGTPTGYNFEGTTLRRSYYLASPGDPMGKVTHSTGTWGAPGYGGKMTDSQIRVYDWGAGQWTNVDVTLGLIDFSNGTSRTQRELNSWNFGWQGSLWNDRIIPTLGWRRDEVKNRRVAAGNITDANGNIINPTLTNVDRWVDGVYQWQTLFNRWIPWEEISGDTSTKGVVIRPLKGWSFVERPAASGSVLAEFLSTLGFTYNESDNFNPPVNAATDVFRNKLPKPEGKGKDWGVQFSLFKNKLFARINWFEATNMNDRSSGNTASGLLSRLTANMDTTLFRNYCISIIRIQDGEVPTDPNWGKTALTDEQEKRVGNLWGLPYDYYSGMNYAATQDNIAKGLEIQVTYNPLPNWTMKFTASKQKTVYENVATQYDAWLASRMPVWQAAKHPELAHITEGSNGTPWDLTNFWTSYGYNSNVLQSNAANTDVSKYYSSTVNAYVGGVKALEGSTAPNQREWRASYVTSYQFTRGVMKGFSIGGAERWEDRAVMNYYGKVGNPQNSPTVIDTIDLSRPIYTPENWYTDLWISYSRKIMHDKVRMKLQLNVSNVFEDGGLQAIAANFDGVPVAFRIVDSRQFVFSASFEF